MELILLFIILILVAYPYVQKVRSAPKRRKVQKVRASR